MRSSGGRVWKVVGSFWGDGVDGVDVVGLRAVVVVVVVCCLLLRRSFFNILSSCYISNARRRC